MTEFRTAYFDLTKLHTVQSQFSDYFAEGGRPTEDHFLLHKNITFSDNWVCHVDRNFLVKNAAYSKLETKN